MNTVTADNVTHRIHKMDVAGHTEVSSYSAAGPAVLSDEELYLISGGVKATLKLTFGGSSSGGVHGGASLTLRWG